MNIKTQQQPRTFFGSYRSRLFPLAAKHDVKLDALKALIDIAFHRCGAQVLDAQLKLAQLKIGLSEIKFLFQHKASQK
jgi:hypothetical protein